MKTFEEFIGNINETTDTGRSGRTVGSIEAKSLHKTLLDRGYEHEYTTSSRSCFNATRL